MDMIRMVLLAALAMSVGWGFRGDYGHEAGAILPGALLGLSLAMASGRADWQQRSTLIALFCGLGWAIGGQMSYGIVIGYTRAGDLLNASYGYGSLFLIGALWGAIGAVALGVSLTWKRSELASFAWPLILLGTVWFLLDFSGWTDRLGEETAPWPGSVFATFDVDWVAAVSALVVSLACAAIPVARKGALVIALISAGWLIGFVLLVPVLGLRMTPPRSDNWAGCVGMFIALVIWVIATRQRAVAFLMASGFLAGGFGFALGDFIQTLGNSGWGPFEPGRPLAGLNYWKWMEQFFGLLMGLGVALSAVVLVRGKLAPAVDDHPRGALDIFAWVFLLVIMPWKTMGVKNLRDWHEYGLLIETFAGVPIVWSMLLAVAFMTCIVLLAAWKHQQGKLPLAPASHLGRAQWLFLILLWACLAGDFAGVLPRMDNRSTYSVHLSFWITAALASLLVVSISEPTRTLSSAESRPVADVYWRPGWTHLALLVLVPVVIYGIAAYSVSIHDGPLPGLRERFVTETPAS